MYDYITDTDQVEVSPWLSSLLPRSVSSLAGDPADASMVGGHITIWYLARTPDTTKKWDPFGGPGLFDICVTCDMQVHDEESS